jgi:hypothetical protein
MAGGVAPGVGPEFKLQYYTHTHTHTHTKGKNSIFEHVKGKNLLTHLVCSKILLYIKLNFMYLSF